MDECVSCLKGTMFCKTLDPNTSPMTAAHLSSRSPLLQLKSDMAILFHTQRFLDQLCSA